LALEGLCFYHCVRDCNIIEVIKSQTIKTKNVVFRGEMTNSTTDIFQGFDHHLSMSIGAPWVEYGPFSFIYGIENLSDTALFFMADPWLHSNKKLQESYFNKADFILLAKLLASKNIVLITKTIGIKVPFISADKLLAWDFRRWEVKQDANLSILDSTEIMFFDSVDSFLITITSFFNNIFGLTLLGLLVLAICMVTF
jgi:hypothetical protein